MFADMPGPPESSVFVTFAVAAAASVIAILVSLFLIVVRLTGRKIWAAVVCVPVLLTLGVVIYFVEDYLPRPPRPPRPSPDRLEKKTNLPEQKQGTSSNLND
ncbi:MAG: hypothetical protein EXR98_16465 [Gemmataceae bacterium]|nr:hypothetical protein [Gemmataceae bacterium]